MTLKLAVLLDHAHVAELKYTKLAHMPPPVQVVRMDLWSLRANGTQTPLSCRNSRQGPPLVPQKMSGHWLWSTWVSAPLGLVTLPLNPGRLPHE